MKYIPKYITTDILAEYGEHLTHEAYNEMVKLNITQGDYNTTVLNQLFNTDEGIQIPYLENKIKVVTDAQEIINEDMEHIIEDMIALKGSLNKYTTFCDVRRMMTECSQNFVKINKIKAGDNIEVVVDANKNVIISADSGVSQEYVDTHDASTLNTAKNYTDTKISEIPIPVVPTNISAFVNDVGYITDYTETDPIFGASPAAGIESSDITNWNSKQEELVSGTNIKTINNISLLGSGNIDIQGGGGVETDPVFTASPAFGITNQDITDWNNKSTFSGDYNDLTNKPTIPVVPTNVSAFTNDAGYLTSESDPIFSASAAAGITSTDITAWNNKSDFSGNYNDLTNKPIIPSSKINAINYNQATNIVLENIHEHTFINGGVTYYVKGTSTDTRFVTVSQMDYYHIIPDYNSLSNGDTCIIGYRIDGYNGNNNNLGRVNNDVFIWRKDNTSTSGLDGGSYLINKHTSLNKVLTTEVTPTISKLWKFTTLPQSSVVPTNNDQLVNKAYVDGAIPTVPTNVSAFTNDAGYITGYTETDPVFSASVAAGITAADITRWNNSGGGGAVALEDIAAPYSSYASYEFNDLCVYNNQIWEANSRGQLNPPDPNDPAEWGQVTGHSSVYDHAIDRALNELASKFNYRDVTYDPGAGSSLDTGKFLFLYE